MRRTTLYTLEVTITNGQLTDDFVKANPVVSRTVEIRADQTLNQLHRAIFEAFGRWDDCHLSEFNMGGGVHDRGGDRYVLQFIYDDPVEVEFFGEVHPTGSMERTRIGKLGLQPGQAFWYWYDFGDDWVHRITVVSVGEAEPGARYPKVVASVGESPPQYRSWDDEDLGDPIERASQGHEPRRARGGREMSSDIETGVTPFPDGSVVEWQHEVLSPGEAEPMVGRAVGRTYRVTTFRQLGGGALVIGTYLVPGAWLNACVREIARDEGEMVLGVEVVDSGNAGSCRGSGEAR